MNWWQWLLIAILVPGAIFAIGVVWGGVEWISKLLTAWMFKK